MLDKGGTVTHILAYYNVSNYGRKKFYRSRPELNFLPGSVFVLLKNAKLLSMTFNKTFLFGTDAAPK